jgi:hypothetical protein
MKVVDLFETIKRSDLKKGMLIRLKSTAQPSLSWKEGIPPQSLISNEIWVIDDLSSDKEEMINISTLESPQPGSYCSFIALSDIKEIVSNPTTSPEIQFMKYAQSKGYKDKVVGDNSYSKDRRKANSSIIKLLGAKNHKLQIYEDGKGRYEIEGEW